ncbi:MAG: type I glyceraldehyde-3-phosphate dehydrogenase [Candidatus Moranbacteria bacterium]|nr:type I glyceraldehyde-3-phosphate dehydrogenase [Candidatus Moranbacteria bacterium]
MSIKIAINGLGRIGRAALKIALERPDLEIVAVNDLTPAPDIAYLLKYDSVYGVWGKEISAGEKNFKVGKSTIPYFQEPAPENLPWRELGANIVLECTGAFTKSEKAGKHLEAGAKLVILSAPPKTDDIEILLMGCNEKKFNPEKHKIISNASCTTNCLAPVIKVLNDEFGVERALMTTIHSYTASQVLVDGPAKERRESRAAALNIIPSSTGAAVAVTKVLPELEGRFHGMAVRVPSPVVSASDLTAKLRQKVSAEKINNAFIAASQGPMKGILGVTLEELVSTDFKKDPRSSIVDLSLTMVLGDDMAKVFSWYDNEWGYSERLVDLAIFTGKQL